MDGEQGDSDEPVASSPGLDLPAVLAGLDGSESDRQAAIEAVREAVDEEPAACAPTLPKLRDRLSAEGADAAPVAYCLAEIAEATPTDVAPSTDAIVDFVVEEHPSPAATEGFRALAAVAEATPTAVDDHADRLAEAVASGPDPDRYTPRLWDALDRLGRAVPSIALEQRRERSPESFEDRDWGSLAVVAEDPTS